MAFLLEYLSYQWEKNHSDEATLNNWRDFLNTAEVDRQRDRLILWRERVNYDDYAVNADQPIVFKRSAGFVWRYVDPTGTHKTRNHTYMYNLELFGHKTVSRRDPAEVEAAAKAVAARVSKGELGGLTPL